MIAQIGVGTWLDIAVTVRYVMVSPLGMFSAFSSLLIVYGNSLGNDNTLMRVSNYVYMCMWQIVSCVIVRRNFARPAVTSTN